MLKRHSDEARLWGRLTCVYEQIDQNSLKFVGVANYLRNTVQCHLERHAVLSKFAFEQHGYVLNNVRHVERFMLSVWIASQRKDASGNFCRPTGSIVDASERLVARRIVFVPHAELGIVDDGHQQIVELVSCRAS